MKQLIIILTAFLLSTSAIAADWKQEGKANYAINVIASKQRRTNRARQCA